jgi:hypothetical protein
MIFFKLTLYMILGKEIKGYHKKKSNKRGANCLNLREIVERFISPLGQCHVICFRTIFFQQAF